MTTAKRHVLLTAFLIFKIVALSATFLAYIFSADQILAANPGMPRWAIATSCVLSLIDIASAVAIFCWMKWGFWILCMTALVSLLINLYSDVSPMLSFLGVLGPLILYGLLQLGGKSNAWSHLR
jgi:hypothetical protein